MFDAGNLRYKVARLHQSRYHMSPLNRLIGYGDKDGAGGYQRGNWSALT